MHRYTSAVLADIHYTYGWANGNSNAVQRIYQETYPQRQCPANDTFRAIHRRLAETGSFLPLTRGKKGMSEHLTLKNGCSTWSHRIQEFQQDKSLHRWGFLIRVCGEFFVTIFSIRIMCSDCRPSYQLITLTCNVLWMVLSALLHLPFSSVYSLQMRQSSHGMQLWTSTPVGRCKSTCYNPVVKSTVLVERLGTIGNYLIGPVFLPPRLNVPNYRNFLENELPPLLEDILLYTRQQLGFMHDGAQPTLALLLGNFLTNIGRWIGRGGPTAWSPRSPDLNLLDFFV